MVAESKYDVFLCHNAEDKLVIKNIALELKEKDLMPWLDEWELQPGLPWQSELEKSIKNIRSAAVFVGKNGVGPWQQKEIEAFLRQFIRRGCPLIPAILPDCEEAPELPVFLETNTWVDFRVGWDEALEKLKWGITGRKPKLMDTKRESKVLTLGEIDHSKPAETEPEIAGSTRRPSEQAKSNNDAVPPQEKVKVEININCEYEKFDERSKCLWPGPEKLYHIELESIC